MKILFSPAETKKIGGIKGKIDSKCFLFPELFNFRKEVLDRYDSFVRNSTDEELSKFFGLKDYKKFQKYKTDIYQQPLMKVIERYNGVAFDYLKYSTLDRDSQHYIDENVIIFSNLFGPLNAGDFGIPEYRLKQGEKIGDFAPEVFYKKYFSEALNGLLDEPYLDLRAGFYNKFYKPSSKYTTLKFLKNGKVVSHWAKAYRGIILRELAQHNIKIVEDFIKLNIQGLTVKEVLYKSIHTEIVYEIINEH